MTSQTEIIRSLENANKGLCEELEAAQFEVQCLKAAMRRFDESSKGKDWRRREALERVALEAAYAVGATLLHDWKPLEQALAALEAITLEGSSPEVTTRA